MPTLVLPPRYTSDSQRLWRAAIDAGWDVQRLSWRPEPGENVVDPVIYGESFFAHAVAERFGVSLVDPAPDFLVQVSERAPQLVGRSVFTRSLEEAWGLVGPAFVKPAEEKGFQAKVYENGRALRKATEAFDPNLLVLVSEPVSFDVEYRFFVIGGSDLIPMGKRVVAGSVYIRNGDIAEVDGEWPCDAAELATARAFAESALYSIGPGWTTYTHGLSGSNAPSLLPAGLVLDVGRFNAGARKDQWGIVEANPAWGAGLCGCDAAPVLEVLRRTTVPVVPQP